ncbi:unnamed protein product [Linum tenue]|uniref:non-specific serine/threonine protein kinase n=1 Tax=Linum tenue TaxID=586396 RepID=A0AAV0ICH6_9ROSI|nr:unnamed protein product [Linum tenue]
MEGWEWEGASGELSDEEICLEDNDDNEELLNLSGHSKKLQFRSDASKAIWNKELGMAEVIEKRGKMWITVDFWLRLGHYISWTLPMYNSPCNTCTRRLQKRRMVAAGSFLRDNMPLSIVKIEALESLCGGISVKFCHVEHGRVSFFSMKKAELPFHGSTAQQQPRIKAAYWYSGSGYPVAEIDSSLFTHLVCGFATVNSSTFQLSTLPSDSKSFTAIVRRRNPAVTTLLSVWNGEQQTARAIAGENVAAADSLLSAVASTPSRRNSFIESTIRAARIHGFQGIDLNWVWPNATDAAAIGPLLDEFKSAIDSESEKSNNSKLTLTMVVRRSPNFGSLSYPVQSMARNLDWAHLLAFDYHLPTRENFTANHAALFNPSGDRNDSTDAGVREWIRVGFPVTKLVLGLAYHGYGWKLANPGDNYLGAPATGPAVTIAGDMGYKQIKSFIQNYGFGARATYNSTYVVNYFVVGSNWINFDGVEAIGAKVSYAVEMGLAGFIAFQLSNDDNWELSRAAQLTDMEGRQNRRQLLLKVLLPIAAVITLSAIVLWYARKRVLKQQKGSMFHGYTRSYNNSPGQAKASRSSSPAFFGSREPPNLQAFTFSDIKAATNNFSTENLLGSGGFGPVYKGVLPGGEEIAVKRLSESSTQGIVEFRNEVSLTARLQHVNLVRVVGFCTEKEEKMLVYEFMPNRSLDFYLFDPVRRLKLDWNKRVAIIEGVTQGLLYLQEYSNFTIIHRDIKASNILLDDGMNPKISDFGMARLFRKDLDEANTSRIVGTYGYVPPEYVKRGIYSMKYDVYSFGVVLLQIISGKRTQFYYGSNEDLHLLEHAYESWRNGEGMEFFDSALDDSSSHCKLMTCLQLGLLCVQENPDDRPTMLEVSSVLRIGALGMATPERPAFSTKKENREEMESGTTSRSQRQVCSFNEDDLSQVEPR